MTTVPWKKSNHLIFRISMALAIGAISIFAINLLLDGQHAASAFVKPIPASNAVQPINVDQKRLTVNADVETVAQRPQLHLNFTGQSWIQLRYINDKSTDRLYQKGESLSFDIERLSSLVIGNAEVTELEVGGKKVARSMLSPYTRGLVVRLNQQDIRRLEP